MFDVGTQLGGFPLWASAGSQAQQSQSWPARIVPLAFALAR